jgi:hypothetical protein
MKQNIVNKESRMQVNVKEKLDPLYHFISGVYASFPEDNFTVESMTIKKDQVFIHYKTGPETAEADSPLANDKAVTVSNLRVLKMSDNQVMEQLNAVYQVNVPFNAR